MSVIDASSNVKAGSITENIPTAMNIKGFYLPLEHSNSIIKSNISLIASSRVGPKVSAISNVQSFVQNNNKKVA